VKILGIDPGTYATGYGLIHCQNGVAAHIVSGTISTKRKESLKSLPHIFSEVERILEKYKPDAVAIEDIFYSLNVKSALKLGHVRGVILLAVLRSDIPVHTYTPLEIKKAVVGYGRAEKAQVQKMVVHLLKMDHAPVSDDASDALAIAICHFHGAKKY
jgi:crossover junction endodeoxyribonuclease RuvC